MQSNFTLKILAASAIIALTGGMAAANAAPAPETPSPEARQALSQLNDQQAMEFIETVTNGRLTDKDRAAMPEVLRRFRSGNLRQAPGDNFIDSLINIVGPYFYKVLPLYMNLVFNRTLPDMADTGTMKVDTIYPPSMKSSTESATNATTMNPTASATPPSTRASTPAAE